MKFYLPEREQVFVVSEETVREIIRHELEENIQEIEKSSIGRAHNTFFFEIKSGRFVLKSADEEARFQIEGPAIEHLISETDVKVPELIGYDNSKSEFDSMYLITRFEPGENIDTFESETGRKFRYLSVDSKKEILRSAGETLGMLHNQTSFDQFGFFESKENNLVLREESSWREIFEHIILEEQMANFPDRFCDLKDLIEEFLEENLEVLNGVDSACMMHRDFRWSNIKVRKGEIGAVFDWERAISGHGEYDLAKAEESLIQVKSEKLYSKYRKSLLDGYRKQYTLKKGWRKRIEFYKSLRAVEGMWTFEGWTEGMSDEKKQAMADFQRSDLKEKIGRYRKDFS